MNFKNSFIKKGLVLFSVCAILTCVTLLYIHAAGMNVWYISQSGLGTQSGTDAADAAPVSTINSLAGWSAHIGQGGQLHLVGAISNNFEIYQGGINSSSPTMVIWEPGASVQAPTFPNNTILFYMANQNNIIFDGVTDGNGVIMCTDNGTSSAYTNTLGVAGTNAYSNYNLQGFYVQNCTNIIWRHLYMGPLYNRFPSSDDPPVGSYLSQAFDIASGSELTWSNNVISNYTWELNGGYGVNATSNWLVYSNQWLAYDHGVECACGNGGPFVPGPIFINLTIASNGIHSMNTYEAPFAFLASAYHRDNIFLFNLSVNTNFATNSDPSNYFTGYISNVYIHHNLITAGLDPNTLQSLNPQSDDAGSAAIFNHDYSSNQAFNIQVYDNIIRVAMPLGFTGYAVSCGVGTLCANNDIIGWTTVVTNGGKIYSFPANLYTNTSGSTVTYYGGLNPPSAWGGTGTGAFLNNLAYNCTCAVIDSGQITSNNYTGSAGSNPTNLFFPQYFTNIVYDYNAYCPGNLLQPGFNNQFEDFDMLVSFGGTGGTTGSTYQWIPTPGSFSAWQQWGVVFNQPHMFDANSTIQTPLIDLTTLMPAINDTVVKQKGTNLSAYFNTDFYGNPRPATGPWDIGAVQSSFNTLYLYIKKN